MSLQMGFQLNLALAHRISLQQLMANSHILALPVGAIDSILENIANNPEKSESIIRARNQTGDTGIKCLLAEMLPAGKEKAPEGSVISTLDLNQLAPEKLNIYQADGLYIPKGIFDKPDFVPAPSLEPLKVNLSQFQIPSEYKNTRTIFNFLRNQREWAAKQLRSSYDLIGSRQREFISTLKESRLNMLKLKDIGKELEFSASTASRLLQNRYVGIRHEQKDIILPTDDLFCNPFDMFLYSRLNNINNLFRVEAEEGVAVNDKQIADRVTTARRTIAKYRALNNIPEMSSRQQEYNLGRKEPYQIKTKFEGLR